MLCVCSTSSVTTCLAPQGPLWTCAATPTLLTCGMCACVFVCVCVRLCVNVWVCTCEYVCAGVRAGVGVGVCAGAGRVRVWVWVWVRVCG